MYITLTVQACSENKILMYVTDLCLLNPPDGGQLDGEAIWGDERSLSVTFSSGTSFLLFLLFLLLFFLCFLFFFFFFFFFDDPQSSSSDDEELDELDESELESELLELELSRLFFFFLRAFSPASVANFSNSVSTSFIGVGAVLLELGVTLAAPR